MTQTWEAVLAPIGVAGVNPQVISPNCEITLRDKAPLLTIDGDVIGHVIDVSISDGYLIAKGVLHEGCERPTTSPTFDFGLSTKYTISDFTIMFEVAEVTAVRTGFTSAWDDPRIAFTYP